MKNMLALLCVVSCLILQADDNDWEMVQASDCAQFVNDNGDGLGSASPSSLSSSESRTPLLARRQRRRAQRRVTTTSSASLSTESRDVDVYGHEVTGLPLPAVTMVPDQFRRLHVGPLCVNSCIIISCLVGTGVVSYLKGLL